MFAYGWGFTIPGVPRDSLLTQALRASDGAFVADSGLAMTWVTRAAVMRQVSPSTRADVFRAVGRALAVDSLSAEAWYAYAMALAETDSLDRAIQAWRRSVALKPTFVEAVAFMGFAHLWSERYDSAATWADSAIALDPTAIISRLIAGSTALARGDPARAEREFAAAERLGGGTEHVSSLAGLAMARAAGGTVRALAVSCWWPTAPPLRDGTFPVHTVVWLAEAWAILGERDQAFVWLGRFGQPRRPPLPVAPATRPGHEHAARRSAIRSAAGAEVNAPGR